MNRSKNENYDSETRETETVDTPTVEEMIYENDNEKSLIENENNTDQESNNSTEIQISINKMKSLAKHNKIAGIAYTGYSTNGGKVIQNMPKNKKEIKENCGHTLEEPKSSKSFMCGAFTKNDRKYVFKKFWKMKTWEEERCFVQGIFIQG